MELKEFMNKARDIYQKDQMHQFGNELPQDYRGKEYLYLTMKDVDKNIVVVKIFVGSLKRVNELEPKKEEYNIEDHHGYT